LQQVSQVLQVGAQVVQVSQQSQLLWKWLFSLLKQLSLQHVSHVLPQLPPQHDEAGATTAGEGAGVGATLAGAAASAPANQAVVTNRNAAFTSFPP